MSLLVFMFGLLTVDDVPPPAAGAHSREPAAQSGSPTGDPGRSHDPGPAETRRAGRGEFHFDALRIDGLLRGPEAMVVKSRVRRGEEAVLELRRSFLHRVYETVEVPALHGGR